MPLATADLLLFLAMLDISLIYLLTCDVLVSGYLYLFILFPSPVLVNCSICSIFKYNMHICYEIHIGASLDLDTRFQFLDFYLE